MKTAGRQWGRGGAGAWRRAETPPQGSAAAAREPYLRMAWRHSAPASPSAQEPMAELWPSHRPTAAAGVGREPGGARLQRDARPAGGGGGGGGSSGGASPHAPADGEDGAAAASMASPASRLRRASCWGSCALPAAATTTCCLHRRGAAACGTNGRATPMAAACAISLAESWGPTRVSLGRRLQAGTGSQCSSDRGGRIGLRANPGDGTCGMPPAWRPRQTGAAVRCGACMCTPGLPGLLLQWCCIEDGTCMCMCRRLPPSPRSAPKQQRARHLQAAGGRHSMRRLEAARPPAVAAASYPALGSTRAQLGGEPWPSAPASPHLLIAVGGPQRLQALLPWEAQPLQPLQLAVPAGGQAAAACGRGGRRAGCRRRRRRRRGRCGRRGCGQEGAQEAGR